MLCIANFELTFPILIRVSAQFSKVNRPVTCPDPASWPTDDFYWLPATAPGYSHVASSSQPPPYIHKSMASRYLPYLSLLVPPLLVASYVLTSLPIVSNRLPAPADPGLANLPSNSRVREIYPENWQEGGNYVQFPVGRVCTSPVVRVCLQPSLGPLLACRARIRKEGTQYASAQCPT